MATPEKKEKFRASLDKNRVHMDGGEHLSPAYSNAEGKVSKDHPFLLGATKTKTGAYTGLTGAKTKEGKKWVKGVKPVVEGKVKKSKARISASKVAKIVSGRVKKAKSKKKKVASK